MRKISYIVFACVLYIPSGNAKIASQEYVNGHTTNYNNPHQVTKAQVGLGNVPNVDTTNAANITNGALGYDRLPVGTTANTVAAGDDARFYAIPTTQPTVNAPEGMVLVWFN
jgi:hypothetical protein